MTNFRITVAYDGSRYGGWQRLGGQDNTIQGKLEHVLSEMTGHRVEIHGAGRTDAGVHARGQVAHFKIETGKTPDEIRAYLNRYLPEDIAVTACDAVDDRFHARLNAKAKRYVYRIWNSATPNVFERKYLCRWEAPLDTARMQAAAARLVGEHDFKAFYAEEQPARKMLDFPPVSHLVIVHVKSQDEQAAAVLPGDVGEAPDVAEANRAPGGQENEAQAAR